LKVQRHTIKLFNQLNYDDDDEDLSKR
jgi:hypothetical protein